MTGKQAGIELCVPVHSFDERSKYTTPLTDTAPWIQSTRCCRVALTGQACYLLGRLCWPRLASACGTSHFWQLRPSSL